MYPSLLQQRAGGQPHAHCIYSSIFCQMGMGIDNIQFDNYHFGSADEGKRY